MLILISQIFRENYRSDGRGHGHNGPVRTVGMLAKKGVIWLQGFSDNIVTFLCIDYNGL